MSIRTDNIIFCGDHVNGVNHASATKIHDAEMETIIFLGYPGPDVAAIEQQVRARDTFVALLTGDLYNVLHYHDPRHEFEFLGYLDRNIYSRISSLVTGRTSREQSIDDLRWAAAVLAFSQIAKITFDYASSIYELASAIGGPEAAREVQRFRAADNSDPRLFIDFALGRIRKILTDQFADVTVEKDVDPSEFEKRTNDFRINYIFALKIAELGKSAGKPVEKMLTLINWMRDRFMFGSPALLFANRYFSPNRFRRMLKGFSKQNIQNAAWDLTFLQNWRRAALKGIKINKPAILMSGDKAVKDVARRITAESDEEFANHLREPWGPKSKEGMRIFEHYRTVWGMVEREENRRQTVPK